MRNFTWEIFLRGFPCGEKFLGVTSSGGELFWFWEVLSGVDSIWNGVGGNSPPAAQHVCSRPKSSQQALGPQSNKFTPWMAPPGKLVTQFQG